MQASRRFHVLSSHVGCMLERTGVICVPTRVSEFSARPCDEILDVALFGSFILFRAGVRDGNAMRVKKQLCPGSDD